jgi:hypothetical protein
MTIDGRGMARHGGQRQATAGGSGSGGTAWHAWERAAGRR